MRKRKLLMLIGLELCFLALLGLFLVRYPVISTPETTETPHTCLPPPTETEPSETVPETTAPEITAPAPTQTEAQ